MNKTQKVASVLGRELGEKLEEHKPLRDLLPLAIGGAADFYTAVETIADLMRAIKAARTAEVDWLVIGSGSQTIISDFGFPGLVIHNRAENLQYVPSKGQVLADGGAAWPKLVLGAVGYDLGGVEPFLVMQGTIGGALVQDRCAPSGHSARSILREVTLMSDEGEIEHLSVQKFYKRPRHERGTLLVALLQLVHGRHDEVIRRVGLYERERRRLAGAATTVIGPVFAHESSTSTGDLVATQLSQAKILGLKSGGAIFSTTRPNYIEARGRVTAHDIRELVSNAQHTLSEQLTDPPIIQLQFVGNWQEESV